MTPTVGRIVHYRLNADDAALIDARRNIQGIAGNEASVGDTVPALIVRVWPDGTINAQIFLDGTDNLWATTIAEGTEPGTWAWPTIS